MKRNYNLLKKITSILVAFCLVISGIFLFLRKSQALTPKGYVTISIEKFTLGKGYIVEPIKVPFYEEDNGANVLTNVLAEYGKEYKYTGKISDTSGQVESTFYLSHINDDDYTDAKISQYILNKIKKDGVEVTGRKESGWLGEFDYTNMSGWMYCVNNKFPNYGASTYKPQDGDVIRWQFTVYGYGWDLGDYRAGGEDEGIKHADKDKLTEAIANINSSENKSKLLSNSKLKNAYDTAINVLETMESSQEDVYSAYSQLEESLQSQNDVVVSFDADNGSDTVSKTISQDEKLNYTPDIPTKKGYTFVGWYKDTNDVTTAYKSGSTYTENTIYKAKWAHVTMLGAQGKVVADNKSGIRFGTKIYDDGDKIVEKGTLIIPAKLLHDGESLTLETPSVVKSVAKVNYEVNKEQNYITYLGTIVNIKRAQFDVQMTASSYVIYQDKSGNQYTVYSPYEKGSISVYDLLGNDID